MGGFEKFLHMGGYAGFVWPSYIAVFGLLAVLTVISLRALKRAEKDLAEVEGNEVKHGDETQA